MSIQSQYQRKLVSAEKAVQVVKSGDWLEFNSFNGHPLQLDRALAGRKEELKDVKIRGVSCLRPIACVEADPQRKHFTYNSWHMSKLERDLHDRNLCNYIPIAFHEMEGIYPTLTSDVAMLAVCPMDQKGFFNIGPQATHSRALVNNARHVLVEINTNMPVALGGNNELIHISEVDYVVETDNPPLAEVVSPPAGLNEKAIAELIIKEIHDGCCLQLGIGALPNLIGRMIAESGIRHLGVHTEMLADSYVDMYEAGCIDGTKKTTDPRKMVYGFAIGTQKLYDFVNNNSVCAIYSGSYTNSPIIAAKNSNFIAINNAVEVDLFGQVASESTQGRHISGTGGQLDFIKAGYMSRGGKGIICLSSSFKSKDGRIRSRISPSLLPGTIATLPRSMTHYVCTEFGIVNLKGASTWERAEKLIAIAHPDFQDELIKQAQDLRIWTRCSREA